MDHCVAGVLHGGSTVWAVWVTIVVACILAQQLHPENNTLTSVVAGALTGIVETLLMFPIENIKTQQQLNTLRGGGGAVIGSGSAMKPMSFIDTAKRTWRRQGCLGFYRGMAPVLFCAVPNQALRWTSFDAFCSLLNCLGNGAGSLWAVALSGVLSGIVVAIITGVPVETAKTQAIHTSMVHHPHHHVVVPDPEDTDIDILEGSTILPTSPAGSFSPTQKGGGGGSASSFVVSVPSTSMVLGNNNNNNDGGDVAAPPSQQQRSVLRGWLPTIVKKIGNQGVRFPVHRATLNFLCGDVARTCDASKNPLLGFIAGAAAGMSSIVATQPVDVVKTRMQGLNAERYGHSWSCAWRLLKEEGIQVFFHGMAARALRSGLGAGFAFSFFPVVKAFLHSDLSE